MMNSCILFAIGVGLVIGTCHSTMVTPDVKDTVVVEDKSTTTHVSTTIAGNTDEEIMGKLKELWETQRDYLETIQEAAENVTQLTQREIKGIDWLFNDAEWLIERQLDELSIQPKTITEAINDVMADDLIGLQVRNWEKFEKCLSDHYKFEKKDDMEKLMRTTLETARTDLEHRQEQIKSLVKEEVVELPEKS